MSDQPFVPGYSTCDAVSDQCPVSATLYGDYFTKNAVIFFSVAYALLLALQVYYTWKSRAWSFAAWLGVGTIFELAGYVCRVIAANNPWNFLAFVIQLLTLMLGPTLIAAAISITFKHLVIHYGAQWSTIKPRWYPWLFVGSDVFSIIIQAAGCGLAAMATSGEGGNSTVQDASSILLITGVSFQAVNMMVCGGLMLLYYRRRSVGAKDQWQGRPGSSAELNYSTQEEARIRGDLNGIAAARKLKIFVWCISVAFVAIIVRCIYRIPEMASGWGSDLMKDEISFLILDGAMILAATALLSIIHPATYFPQLSAKGLIKEDIVLEEGLTTSRK